MTWIFEVSVEGAICEPKKINFFYGSDKLLMIEVKSKQVYNHVDVWYAMTQSKWKYFFWIWVFFGCCCCCCWRKYWRLKVQHFFLEGEERGMINKTVITLKINLWKKCWFIKVWFPSPISIGHLSLKVLPDNPHFVGASPRQVFRQP